MSDCDPGWRRWSWAVTFTFAFISFFISDQINRTALHDSYRSSSHITDLIMFWHHILYTWLCCFPSVCLQNHKNTWTIKRLWVIDHTRWQSVCVCVCTRGCRRRNVSYRSTSVSVTRGDSFIDPEKRLYSVFPPPPLIYNLFLYFCSHFRILSLVTSPLCFPLCFNLRALNGEDEKWWLTLREVECEV